MKKRNYLALILVSMVLLFFGCQKLHLRQFSDISGRTEEAEDTEPDIRAAFTENVWNTEGTEDAENTEDAGVMEKEGSAQADTAASDEKYDYVALGNSVTCSKSAKNLWWGNWGMAATSADKDYVHRIAKWLGKQFEMPVAAMVLNLKKWETAKNRDAVLEKYKGYFSAQTDLVTIQTGENITDFKETLESDYLNLVKFIKENAPNAKILMLGGLLWPDEKIEAAKQAACAAYGVRFVDVAEFLNGYEENYRSSIGTKVKGADGKTHKIADEAVAAHPNNKGMACIARLVTEQIAAEDK